MLECVFLCVCMHPCVLQEGHKTRSGDNSQEKLWRNEELEGPWCKKEREEKVKEKDGMIAEKLRRKRPLTEEAWR